MSCSASKLTLSNCQFCGASFRANIFFSTSQNYSSCAGKNSEMGNLVKINVTANALPLRSAKLTACPSSLVR